MDKDKKLFSNLNIEVKADDDAKREITAVGSKQVVDRDNDILFLDGMSLTNFRKNPVVLWSHDARQPPIGKATKVWVDKKELKFKIKFPEPEESSFADTIFKLTKSGYINSLSIGFSPDWAKALFNDKRGGYDFKESELLEVSMVNIPANQGARVIERSLDKAVEDGIIDDLERKDFEINLKDPVVDPKTEQTINEEVTELEDLRKRVETLELQLKETQTEVIVDEPKGEIHIVDQFLEDYFDETDDKSGVSAENTSGGDDQLDSILEELS